MDFKFSKAWPYDIISYIVEWTFTIDPSSMPQIALASKLLADEVEVWRWRDIRLVIQGDQASKDLEMALSILTHRTSRLLHTYRITIEFEERPSYQANVNDVESSLTEILVRTTRLSALHIQDYLYDSRTEYFSEGENDPTGNTKKGVDPHAKSGLSLILSPSNTSRYTFQLSSLHIHASSLSPENRILWNFILYSSQCRGIRSLALHAYFISLDPISATGLTSEVLPTQKFESRIQDPTIRTQPNGKIFLPNLEILYAPLNLLSPLLHLSNPSNIKYIALDIERGEDIMTLSSILSLSIPSIEAFYLGLDTSDDNILQQVICMLPRVAPNIRFLSLSWDGPSRPRCLFHHRNQEDTVLPLHGATLDKDADDCQCCRALRSLERLEFLRLRGLASDENGIPFTTKIDARNNNPENFAGPLLNVVQNEIYGSLDICLEDVDMDEIRWDLGEAYWEKSADVSRGAVTVPEGRDMKMGLVGKNDLTSRWKLYPGKHFVPVLPSRDTMPLLVSLHYYYSL